MASDYIYIYVLQRIRMTKIDHCPLVPWFYPYSVCILYVDDILEMCYEY